MHFWTSSAAATSNSQSPASSPPERVDTIIDFPAIERFGVQVEGNADAGSATVLAELADLIATGDLEVPVAGVYPLDDVQDAYRTLEERHTRGEMVLRP